MKYVILTLICFTSYSKNNDKLLERYTKMSRSKIEKNAIKISNIYSNENKSDLLKIKAINDGLVDGNNEELLILYKKLKHRQEIVSKVAPIHIGGDEYLTFGYINYDNEIIKLLKSGIRNEFKYSNAGKSRLITGRSIFNFLSISLLGYVTYNNYDSLISKF